MRTRPESALQSLFRAVADQREISLEQLARTLSLKPSSLRGKIQPLIRNGLLSYLRDHKHIGVNRDFGRVVGIDVGASHLHFALADFSGEILGESTVKIRPEDGPRDMIHQIKETIRDLARRAGRGRLRGIAIGVPSPVDTEHGVVTFANNLPGWKDIHLGRELERVFRVPVFMENDANMAAVGEHWRGVARGVNNFVFMALGTGVGSGVFIDGNLYRGRNGAAGEVYKMNIDWQTWDQDFPDTGQFESFVSGMGIAAEGRKALAVPSRAEAGGLAEERDAYFVFEAFHQGSAEARAVLGKTFVMLGVGIANVVAILDPDLIVLGGGIAKGAPEFMLPIVEEVVRRIQPTPPPITLSSLEDKAQTYGAIRAALGVAHDAIIRRVRAWGHVASGSPPGRHRLKKLGG
jgi:glucokinase